MNWWKSSSTAVVAAQDPGAKPVRLKIPDGTSSKEIGKDLQTLGLIRSAAAWDLWARWRMFQDSKAGPQAGTYELSKAESLEQIATKIWSGTTVQRSFTVREGWSIKKMAAYFEQEGYFSAKDFLKAVEQFPGDEFAWLPKVSADLPRLEGYLFPDTYQIAPGLTPNDVIRQMLRQFEQVALPVYEQSKGNTNLSLSQWVNLASIVEKEAVVAQERTRIAGVFTNRLKQNISLGSDPTVEYAFGIEQTPDKPLTLNQVQTPHPYNTYVTPGLPPTPIASPGLVSLKATLSPEATDYLYFVARYDGTHVFSRTLAEHESAQGQIRDKQDAKTP